MDGALFYDYMIINSGELEWGGVGGNRFHLLGTTLPKYNLDLAQH